MCCVTKCIVTIFIISIQSIISISARSSKLLYSEQEIGKFFRAKCQKRVLWKLKKKFNRLKALLTQQMNEIVEMVTIAYSVISFNASLISALSSLFLWTCNHFHCTTLITYLNKYTQASKQARTCEYNATSSSQFTHNSWSFSLPHSQKGIISIGKALNCYDKKCKKKSY